MVFDPTREMLTRRGVLRRAGQAAALAAIRSGAMGAETVSPVMAELSDYMAAARSRTMPAAVIEKTSFHVLDALAAMISGSELPPGRMIARFALAHAGNRVATVAASKVLCGAIDAAFVNAMLAHADETDDSHAPSQSHPGCSIVPSALAAGEQFGIGGSWLLRAVALGYDVGTRVTMTVGRGAFQTEHHNSTHSIAGTFGSAAAAASAASLTAQQMRWVLDYAAQQASGIKAWQRDTDHIEKAFVFSGMPARNGITAALLVQMGATGVDDILSGPDNFLFAYAPQADASKLIEQLGKRYEITRTNIKKWSVGSPIQAPLDALEILFQKHKFETDQVTAVTVRVATSEAALVDDREMPDICMQHMLAVMMLDRTASFRAAHDKARMRDPSILRQRAKVKLVPDEDLERRLPRREAVVEVTLVGGTRHTERVEAVRGTAENPMTKADVIAKCRDLMAPVIGRAQCDRLIARVLELERLGNVRELRSLMQRA